MPLVPFEKSAIWKEQQQTYANLGPTAWSGYGVPFYLTCCPLLVRRYFNAFYAFYSDCFAQGRINLEHPVYIFDLGAGTARFAYQFIQLLEKKHLPFLVRYVLTDIAEETFSFWKRHPYLRPFWERKILKMAGYMHGQKEAIYCLPDGNSLEVFHNPVCLIANYFFDTIPQSLYLVKDRKLEKGYVEEMSSIGQLQYEYFPEKGSDLLISTYAKEKGEGKFLYPLGAIETFKSFCSRSCQPILCLHADQAVCTLEQDKKTTHPKIARHGTFSVEVNYYLLAAFAKQQGGESVFEKRADPSFIFAITLLGECAKTFPSLEKERKKWEKMTIYEYFQKSKTLKASVPKLQEALKEGNYDPLIPFALFSTFCKALEKANPKEKSSLCKDLKLCLDQFFPICKEEAKVYFTYAKLASLSENFLLEKKWKKSGDLIQKSIAIS